MAASAPAASKQIISDMGSGCFIAGFTRATPLSSRNISPGNPPDASVRDGATGTWDRDREPCEG